MVLPPLRILADENMPMVSEIFAPFGEVTLTSGRDMRPEQVEQADVLLVRSVTQVNSQLLKKASVQFVGTATIGMDHLDTAYLTKHGIYYSNAPGCNADAVVEYVLSCVFLLAKQKGFNPLDKTYGIVGVGNVGERLRQRLSAAGCQVLINDPPRGETEKGFVSLDNVLQNADVICCHTPLIQDGDYPTHHLLNESNLHLLKADAILLNAGRGPVIDNEVLLQCLKLRSDLTAVLDVWEFEPEVNAELAEHCAIISPHIAGYSLDGKVRGTFMLYQALCQHLNIPEEHVLKDFLPESDLPAVNESFANPLQIMQQIYDPREDDRLLRSTLTLPAEQQATEFDQLRKNYRTRREFSSLTIEEHTQSALLGALGFSISS